MTFFLLFEGVPNQVNYPKLITFFFSRLKEALGLDRVKSFHVGGAPFSTDMSLYFESLDIPVMDCFASTETGPQTRGTFCKDHPPATDRIIRGISRCNSDQFSAALNSGETKYEQHNKEIRLIMPNNFLSFTS